MKALLEILIIVLMAGCSSRSEKAIEQNLDPTNKSPGNYVALSEKHVGFWVYESYFKELQSTKSTKKAGEIGVDDFYRISKDYSIMRMNIHEGGADNIILMISKNHGKICSSDTMETYYDVEFRDELMIVDEKKYIKAPNNENGLNELVNSAFISGEYKIDNKQVKFNINGTVEGVDSLLTYNLNLDYSDAGMQLDKIYLGFKNNHSVFPYTYQMNADTLFISAIECKTFEDDFCVEIEKGKIVYKFIKK